MITRRLLYSEKYVSPSPNCTIRTLLNWYYFDVHVKGYVTPNIETRYCKYEMLNLFAFAHALMYNFHYLYHVLYSKLQDNICMVKHLMLIASNFYTSQEDIWCTE